MGTQPCGSPVAVWGYKMLFAFSRSKELKMNKPVKLAVTAVFVCFASDPHQAPRAAFVACGVMEIFPCPTDPKLASSYSLPKAFSIPPISAHYCVQLL